MYIMYMSECEQLLFNIYVSFIRADVKLNSCVYIRRGFFTPRCVTLA